MTHARAADGEGSPSERPSVRLPWSGFPAGLVGIVVVALGVGSGALVTRSKSEFGAFLALVLASGAGGSFAGFLVGGPGLESGDKAAEKANERGWADRLGVFGNWITGAAFVLIVGNAGEIVDWFSSMTGAVAKGAGGHGDTLFQYALGSWMIAAASLGFAVGFMQMVTTGRRLIGAASKAEAAADSAEAAATTAAKAAEAAVAAAARTIKP